MGIIGNTVVLHQRTQTSTDGFGAPIYTDELVNVDNVLIGEPATDDITSSTQLYGKKIEYMLGIPKGDTHNWQDTLVEFFGHTYKTFGFPIVGIEENIPLAWHMKVRVERYG